MHFNAQKTIENQNDQNHVFKSYGQVKYLWKTIINLRLMFFESSCLLKYFVLQYTYQEDCKLRLDAFKTIQVDYNIWHLLKGFVSSLEFLVPDNNYLCCFRLVIHISGVISFNDRFCNELEGNLNCEIINFWTILMIRKPKLEKKI